MNILLPREDILASRSKSVPVYISAGVAPVVKCTAIICMLKYARKSNDSNIFWLLDIYLHKYSSIVLFCLSTWPFDCGCSVVALFFRYLTIRTIL